MSNVRDIEKHHALRRATYWWYVEHGICPGCGRNIPDLGRTFCAACLKKDRQRGKAVDPQTGLSKNALTAKKRREQLQAAGLCIHCGKREPREGFKMCARCAEMRNDSVRKWRILRRMDREAEKARSRNGNNNNPS